MRVGLTGGIASGKTAVSDRLADLGAYVIDADLLAREVVEPGRPALASLVARFGEAILSPDGQLDRAALGKIVFADADARRFVESVIHPAVRRRAAELEESAPAGVVVVHVIPLLVETDQVGDYDVVVVVDAPEEAQLARLADRNGLDEAAARARLAAQVSRPARLAAADIVFDNSGGRDSLDREVGELWARLNHSWSTSRQGGKYRADKSKWHRGPTE